MSAFFFFFSSRRRHTRCSRDWSSDVCSSDLGFRRSRGWREVHAKRRTSPPQWAPEWTRPCRPGSPVRLRGFSSSSDDTGVRFPNAGVGDLMQPPEVLQGLFLLVLGQLQEARLQVHRPSPEFREPALPEDLVKLSAEPELDQILDDRMGGGLQNRLRGFRGADARAPWGPLIREELHGVHLLLREGEGPWVDDEHPGELPTQG